MTAMRVIRRGSLRATPWKNGGGETREIACFPPGSSLDDFAWRLSTATVTQDGAFSIFDGIDRRLYLLEGAGMNLRFGTGETCRIGTKNHIDFKGEVPVYSSLIDGPVVDFNIMVRRDRQRAHIEERIVAEPTRIDIPWSTAALFVRSGELMIADMSPSITLQAFDTLMLDDEHQSTVSIDGDAAIIVIGVDPV
jgi:environmental stress-induced protein Ves